MTHHRANLARAVLRSRPQSVQRKFTHFTIEVRADFGQKVLIGMCPKRAPRRSANFFAAR